MTFDRNRLPDPTTYFQNQGLTLKGPRSAKWKTTACNFHGGSDSMRVHLATGAWVCMSCCEKGGDVLAYEIKAGGREFVDSAKALGCWVDDGRLHAPTKPLAIERAHALIDGARALAARGKLPMPHVPTNRSCPLVTPNLGLPSNTPTVAGAVSLDTKQAGYIFTLPVAAVQFRGATLWGR